MKWFMIYLAIAQGQYTTQTGLMSTGPFTTQLECEAYAEETWTDTDWTLEPELQNFYNSDSIIRHREHLSSDMGVFYTCVESREPREKILEKLIDVTAGGTEINMDQFLTYPQHHLKVKK